MSKALRGAATLAMITLAACAETKLGDGAPKDSGNAPAATAPAQPSPMVCLPAALTAQEIAAAGEQQWGEGYFPASGSHTYKGWRISPANNALVTMGDTDPLGDGCKPGDGRIVAVVAFPGPGGGKPPISTTPGLDGTLRYYVWINATGYGGRLVSQTGVEVKDQKGDDLKFGFESHPNDGPHPSPKAQWKRPRNLSLADDTLDLNALPDSALAVLQGTPWITCAAKGCCRIDIEVQ